MRSQISNFNASLITTSTSTPQRPPRRRAQSFGSQNGPSSLSVPAVASTAASQRRGSLVNNNSVSINIFVFQIRTKTLSIRTIYTY